MKFRFSDPVFTSKYLSVVFFLGMLSISAITFAPGGEVFQAKAEAVCFQCIILFALLAKVFRERSPGPAFRNAYAIFALLMTFLLLAMSGG